MPSAPPAVHDLFAVQCIAVEVGYDKSAQVVQSAKTDEARRRSVDSDVQRIASLQSQPLQTGRQTITVQILTTFGCHLPQGQDAQAGQICQPRAVL